MRHIVVLVLCIAFTSFLNAQDYDQDEEVSGFFFGPKIGPTVGFQQWNGFERRPMFNYHAAMFIESIDPDFKGAFYGQLGYHSRGSGINVASSFANPFGESFIFRNISFGFGVKKRILTKTLTTPYYFVGLRGEYNISNNLAEVAERYLQTQAIFLFPPPEFVNSFTYGLTFGGGIEFLGSELIQPAVEVSISPDVSNQYQSPGFTATNPVTNQPTTIAERNIKNVSMEISLVIRFMRKVVYID